MVVQALPKGDRGELAVEVLTEAGVDEIVPWQAARCVTRWRDARGEKALDRWRSTAREAAKQSRREWLPKVTSAATTGEIKQRLAKADLALVLHEEASIPLSGIQFPQAGDMAEVILVVGPEGGMAPEEIDAFVGRRCAGGPARTFGAQDLDGRRGRAGGRLGANPQVVSVQTRD